MKHNKQFLLGLGASIFGGIITSAIEYFILQKSIKDDVEEYLETHEQSEED